MMSDTLSESGSVKIEPIFLNVGKIGVSASQAFDHHRFLTIGRQTK